MKRLFIILMLILLAGCKESTDNPADMAQMTPLVQRGVVAEMVEVDNYTYIRLEAVGDEVWIATLPVWVSPGDIVEFSGGAVMKDFYSDTLGKTFDTILFVEDLQISDQSQGQDIVANAHSSAARGPENEPAVSVPMEPITPVGDGKTIAEIFDGYPGQDGQAVQLRARVVKVSSGIMGKNWVTLQDGTGTAPNDKIVSTTLETVSPGDLVDVTAVIRQDVSLGYGYDYSLLLEDAKFAQVEPN